ncbi:MAG: alpha/beta hydrolase [Bacteroidales bacterium]|jgi:pimeloyl-ACP methyl ester carboxylesterase|nr:alpha/beta hydrolase [Bacteroidales bacterium]
MEKHKVIMFENRELHYRDEGREHPQTLVLLHGFLQNLNVWSSFTLTYMRYMRVITIDLPGHGYSATYSDVHTMDFMANAVKAVLDEAGVERCVMAGHSLGGYVALAFADNYSYMLQGLALLHSHAMADDASKRTQRDEVCRQVHLNRAGFIVDFITNLFDDSKREYLAQDIKELRDQCLETREEGILAAQRGMKLRTSRIRTLANLDIPVLFVYGKNDTRIPIEMGLSQAMVPKRSEVLLLDNVAHMSFMEDRDYVKTRLCHFVNQCYGCNK